MSKVSVKKNIIMNAILTMSNFLFPLITFPYVSRILGPSGTGKVGFANSVVSYFVLFSNLGIPYYGMRACSKARDNRRKLSQTVCELMVINFLMTLVTLGFFMLALFYVPKMSSEKPLFLVTATTLVLNVFGIEYMYRGLEQYSYITFRSILFKLISFVALFVFVHEDEDYVVYAGISVFAASASSVMNFIHSRKYISMKMIGKLNLSQHMKNIMVFFAMACAVSIYASLDSAMLGFMTNETEVGYYGAAIKIKSILVAMVNSIGNVLMPRASYYIEQGKMDEFRRITDKALKFVFVASIPLLLFFTLFAEEGILFISGIEYVPAIPGMQIIMPTILFIGITGITGIQIFVPLGKEKYVLYSEIAGAATDLILNAILIPKYQATGAAIGTTIAELVVLGVQFSLLFKIRNDNPIVDSFRKVSYWKIIVGCCISVPSVLLVKHLQLKPFNDGFSVWGRQLDASMGNNGVTLVIAAVVFFVGYGVAMLIMKDEIVLEMRDIFVAKFRTKLSNRKIV